MKLGLLDIAQTLIAQIEDVKMLDRSSSEGTILQQVAHRGHVVILDASLSHDVDVNAPVGDPLHSIKLKFLSRFIPVTENLFWSNFP
jgi:hypothetical protein